MKAILIDHFVDNYNDLRVSDVPDPVPRGPSDVLVNIHVAAVNFVDLLYARGKHQNNRSLVVPPFILGLEFSGTVASEGDGWRPGDSVYGACVGAFAEKVVVQAKDLHRVPKNGWSFEDAAGIAGTSSVSYGALERADLKAGETVLVHAAAGGLGLMAVQIAKAKKCRVIATAGSEEKRNIVRQYGADEVLDYGVEGWEKQVLKLTYGKGVDVVYDSVGLVDKSLKCLAHFGRVLLIGFAGTEGNIEKIAMNRVLLKQAKIIGYRMGETGRRRPEENDSVWEGLSRMMNDGQLRSTTYERRYHGLQRVPEALKDLAARKVWGKAMIHIADNPRKPYL